MLITFKVLFFSHTHIIVFCDFRFSFSHFYSMCPTTLVPTHCWIDLTIVFTKLPFCRYFNYRTQHSCRFSPLRLTTCNHKSTIIKLFIVNDLWGSRSKRVLFLQPKVLFYVVQNSIPDQSHVSYPPLFSFGKSTLSEVPKPTLI